MNAVTDEEIVALYWARDEQAITHTAERFGAYCRTIAMNLLGNARDAEECENDTWLAAWNSMPVNRPERLNAYLAKITRNFALAKVVKRSAKKRGGGELELALEELDDCVPSDYCLEKEVEDRALAESINTFVDLLPEEEQLIFISRYWFFASEREIAEKQGCSRSRISAMLKRSRDKLKTYLLQEGLCAILND